jgi:hypothetical protein
MINVHLMADLAEAIGTKDVFGLKRHEKFNRLLDNVQVTRELDKGRIISSSMCHDIFRHSMRCVVVPFSISKSQTGHLKSVAKTLWRLVSDFHSLSNWVYRWIIRFAMKSLDEVSMDLNS